MAITYAKVGWKDNQTALNAENLNQMDNGIKTVTDEVAKLQAWKEDFDVGAGNDTTLDATFDRNTGTLRLKVVTV